MYACTYTYISLIFDFYHQIFSKQVISNACILSTVILTYAADSRDQYVTSIDALLSKKPGAV